MDREPTSAKEFAGATASIGPERSGQRMQEALVGLFPDWLPSRKSCRKAIDRGDIHCNGQRASTALRVEVGDRVEYRPKPAMTPDPGPRVPRHLHVVRPDNADFALVWKPAGYRPAVRGCATWPPSWPIKPLRGGRSVRPWRPSSGPAAPPYPAHRLDRATSSSASP